MGKSTKNWKKDEKLVNLGMKHYDPQKNNVLNNSR